MQNSFSNVVFFFFQKSKCSGKIIYHIFIFFNSLVDITLKDFKLLKHDVCFLKPP